MSVRLSCPSCNTAFDLGAVPADRRAACPRCADVFPVRGEVAETAPSAPPLAPVTQLEAPTKRGWSLRRTVAVVAVLGLLGFAAGFAVYSNRGAKPKADDPRGGPVPPLAMRQPLDYVSLIAHLPAECNVVFAVRPGLVIKRAEQIKQDPRGLLLRSGVPPQAFAALDQLGVGLEAVDHIVGGAYIGNEGEELRFAIGIAFDPFRHPDEDTVLKRLKAKRVSNTDLFTVELNRVPVPLFLSRVQPPAGWMLGLSKQDFQRDKGYAGLHGRDFHGLEVRDGQQQLVGIRKMLARVPHEVGVWVAIADDRGWTQKPLVKLAAQAPEVKKLLPLLSTLRSGLFTVGFGERPHLNLRMYTADTATAERVRASFHAHGHPAEKYDSTLEVIWSGPLDPELLQRIFADAAK